MTNYKGRDFLLKNGTWSGGTAIADCRTHSLRINHELVDITNKSSNGYRTLLEGAGVKSVTVTFGGVMTNDTGFETFQGYANAGSINAHALGWADGDTLEGSFQVSSFEITGEYNGEQTFTATLESSGSWTFTGA
ncbi:phage major tail protein, TP901-1 family [Gemmata sp. G18]|uniref:Phage major tail protein, TP901-1 family n=1 Tax=Gemmata palustris TaxID=2822762 RepID=A0ABS5BXA9_9BACT|nr:phage tail tube protein [Gemmata palustris]MBP3958339.1 phage major tail protein, TP901-1 family [Gemmata palustris]